MDNTEALSALEYVQRYFDKQAIDYMDEQLEIIRAHLTDPGYVRVPVEPTSRMLTAGYSARQETLKRFALGGAMAPADDGMRAAYSAMLAAAQETSHD